MKVTEQAGVTMTSLGQGNWSKVAMGFEYQIARRASGPDLNGFHAFNAGQVIELASGRVLAINHGAHWVRTPRGPSALMRAWAPEYQECDSLAAAMLWVETRIEEKRALDPEVWA